MNICMEWIFPKLRKHFQFLEDQYKASCDASAGDIIFYRSSEFVVRVWLEREQVFVGVGPRDESFFLDLGHVLRFKRPDLNFKYPRLGIAGVDPDSVIKNLANYLKQEGADLLSGNFSIQKGVEDCIKSYQRKLGL